MKIAVALVLTAAMLVGGCHSAPTGKAVETAGPDRPDEDKNLPLDQMLVAHQCSNCHAADYVRVGPAMLTIRGAFPKPSAADIARLKQSILNGSSGKWGDAIMTPQRQVTPEQADQIVAIILGTAPAQ